MDFDVIVIGGGCAGLTAAVHAAQAGASVMLVEADEKLGGAAALSGGVVYASGTSVQERAGIHDTAEAMYQYMMSLNQWSIRPAFGRIMADNGAGIIDWLIEIGNDIPPEMIVESGVGSCPRGHQIMAGGFGLIQTLSNAAGAAGVEIALGSRVADLIMEDGKVCGIHSEGAEIRAYSIVITTGGFGNSPAMIKRLWPTAAAHGSRTFTLYEDVKFNLGDGILLGERAGANITGYDNGLLVCTPNFIHDVEAFLPEWAMVVNRDGRRFIPENASYAISGYLVNEQPEMRCFAIFDEEALMEACDDDHQVRRYVNDPGSSSWRIDMIRKHVATGRVKVADTIAQLAAIADISAAGLTASVERYNNYADAGEDLEFFKKSKKFYPIRTGPFYAVEIRASAIVSCHAGLEINESGQAVDKAGRPIAGLFVGGETLGCTMGRRYIGGGIGLANALTYGRLAGRSAALNAAIMKQAG